MHIYVNTNVIRNDASRSESTETVIPSTALSITTKITSLCWAYSDAIKKVSILFIREHTCRGSIYQTILITT